MNDGGLISPLALISTLLSLHTSFRRGIVLHKKSFRYNSNTKSIEDNGDIMYATYPMFRNALSGLYIFLGLIALLFTPFVHAGEHPENQNMDLIAVLTETGQLVECHDWNTSDYEALPSLGIAYHALALKDSKTYTKKAAKCSEEANESKPDDTVALCYLGPIPC